MSIIDQHQVLKLVSVLVEADIMSVSDQHQVLKLAKCPCGTRLNVYH